MSGLDETSCFFVDEDGQEIEHGYYFDEVGFAGEVTDDNARYEFSGGHFPYDTSRRKVKRTHEFVLHTFFCGKGRGC